MLTPKEKAERLVQLAKELDKEDSKLASCLSSLAAATMVDAQGPLANKMCTYMMDILHPSFDRN